MPKKLILNEFIIRAKLAHGDKYDYSKVIYNKNNEKVIIICLEHGEFKQIPNSHLNGHGCHKCSHLFQKTTTEEFIKRSNDVHHNFYIYSNTKYINVRTKVEIICPIHGSFTQRPSHHLNSLGCKLCANKNKAPTDSHKKAVLEFITKASILHNNKYDYSKTKYVLVTKKVIIICPDHGEFEQIPYNHLSGSGCFKCGEKIRAKGMSSSNEEFINRSNKIHNNKYEYSLVNYINAYTKVKIICSKHGLFEQTPANHLMCKGCPNCKESKGEKEVRNFLIENKITFTAEKRFTECKYKYTLPFDFYLPDLNICIEFNGFQHYEAVDYWGGDKGFELLKIRDKIKINYCKKNKIKLIIIKHNENIKEILSQQIN